MDADRFKSVREAFLAEQCLNERIPTAVPTDVRARTEQVFERRILTEIPFAAEGRHRQ